MTRRLPARGLVLLALVGLVASCSKPPPPSDASFVGDSITDQARPLLEQRFGVPDSRVVAVGGSTIHDMAVPAEQLAAGDPPLVVINLGTNDVLLLEAAPDIAGQLDAMAHEFDGASCVVIVTVNEHMVSPQGGDPKAIAAELNTTIRGWDGSGNRRVVDWAKAVNDYDAAHDPSGPITTDTVHPTPGVGQTMLLDGIDEAIGRC